MENSLTLVKTRLRERSSGMITAKVEERLLLLLQEVPGELAGVRPSVLLERLRNKELETVEVEVDVKVNLDM